MERLGDYTKAIQHSQRVTSIVRGIVALGQRTGLDHPTDIARRNWPADKAALEIATRAQVAVATTGSITAFNQTAIAQVFDLLGPNNVSAAIARDATRVVFDSASSIFVQGSDRSGTNVSFIKQAEPIPTAQFDLSSGVTLASGMKVGLITVVTSELMRSSSAETLIRTKLREDIGLGFDTVLLGTAAATAGTQPAGLRFGVNATAATAGGGEAALKADLSALAASVASVAGGDLIFVAAPGEAAKIAIMMPQLRYPVYASGGLADGVVCALAPRALAIAGGDRPARIELSREGVLHMDTAPTALTGNATATPIAAAYPIRSLLQTDTVAIKLVIDDISWGWRTTASDCIAWTESVTW